MPYRFAVGALAAFLALAMAACGDGDGGTTDTSAGAKPGFCGWAAEIEAKVPDEPEPVDPDAPLDVERLVAIADELSTFAATLESAAALAPTDRQRAFSDLAGFNREVAAVLTGSGSLRDDAGDTARAAADTVVATLADVCGVELEAQATLAFYEG